MSEYINGQQPSQPDRQTPNASRRKFLRASGLSLALPFLPSLLRSSTAEAAALTASPTRMCYLYVPNGVNMEQWRPQQAEGASAEDFTFNRSTKSLEPHRSDLSFIQGLEHRHAYIHNDGPGDHARASATFLTAARPHKTAGADIHLGVSADQVVAQRVGHHTRLPSLELSCDGVRRSGGCDSGYACAYQFNLAWADETTPVSPEHNPRMVFERLFGDGQHGERTRNFELRQAGQKSMLDFLMAESQMLEKQLGVDDKRKLDEYTTGLRDIESRIQKAEQYGVPVDPSQPSPAGIPDSYRDHIRLMMDVLRLAFETDSTRVATFMLAHDGSNRSFQEAEVNDGHHDLSHHQKNAERLEKIAKIDTFYGEQFAYFMQQMSQAKDAAGNRLLDHTMIVYGSGICDGDRHNHDDLPIVLAGGKALGWQHNRYRKLSESTPMANLHVEMIRQMQVPVETFGDSTGGLQLNG